MAKDLLEAEDSLHFDSDERMGILSRTQEPAILLTCKKIRQECLSVYYRNAFSFRFFWLQPHRSLDRFIQWAGVVGKHARRISKLALESRHQVEEGVEYEAAIELLKVSPFFDVKVHCFGDEKVDTLITEELERDLIAALWKMSRRDGGAVTFSTEDLCVLGRTFMHAMQRYRVPIRMSLARQTLTAV